MKIKLSVTGMILKIRNKE